MSNPKVPEPLEVAVEPVRALQIRSRSGSEPVHIAEAMRAAFEALGDYMRDHPAHVVGPPRAIYTAYGPEGTEFVVAMPIAAAPSGPEAASPVSVGELPGGKALRFTHRGPYRDLARTYEGITGWMRREGLLETEADWEKHMPMWEEYVTDPESTPEEDLVTHIYVPLA